MDNTNQKRRFVGIDVAEFPRVGWVVLLLVRKGEEEEYIHICGGMRKAVAVFVADEAMKIAEKLERKISSLRDPEGMFREILESGKALSESFLQGNN